ncbi:energy transducer TonB [Hymenobacter saemangeumensis]|uniref:Energy transducer TonB n=1 Tax=Hymenobacter saemangeumensis TaxID=1084522 RepID=A0ABP8IR34_9BACT
MMNNAQLATASLDDIVFDGRNKAYGAYVLRATYDRHVTRALLIATSIFLLLISFPIVARMMEKHPDIVEKKGPIYDPIAPPLIEDPIVPPLPKEEIVQPQTRIDQPTTIQFTPPTIVEDSRATTEGLASQDDLLKADPGAVTYTNPNGPTEFVEPVETPIEGPVTEVVDTKIYVSVEQMPSLPGGGGLAAVVAAIQKAVKYPAVDIRNSVEGRVFASFTVNPRGEVVDVKIVKGLSSTLDAETMRAINTLPKFIPGKQNGREVSVSFTVPITYKIQ